MHRLFFAASMMTACGSNDVARDLGASIDSALGPLADNQVLLTVDSGPSGVNAYNRAYVSVTVCAPGDDTNCATIDHVVLDTGSVGLRIVSSALPEAVLDALPHTAVTLADLGGDGGTGGELAECSLFGGGYVWGTVRTADVSLASHTAAGLPIHVLGDFESTKLEYCQGGGNAAPKPLDVEGNGILGVGPFGPECGAHCESSFARSYGYHACTSDYCEQTFLPVAQQPTNPVWSFTNDNNGIVVTLPPVGDAPGGPLQGVLTFGIGTREDNALGGAAVFPMSTDYLNSLTSLVTIAGNNPATTVFDTGTPRLVLDDSAIPTCSSGPAMGYYCPTSNVVVHATLTDVAGAAHGVDVPIASAMTLFGNSTPVVMKDLGEPGGLFAIFGLPFFYGRSIFIGYEGRTVDGATTPFSAL